MVAVKPANTRKIAWTASLVAAGGAIATLCGTQVDGTRTAFSYLTAYCFAVSLPLGALLLLMMGYAINATWMAPLRRLCEIVAMGLFPVALLFIPVALAAPDLYVWMQPLDRLPPELAHSIAHKRAFLNLPAFCIRTALYFVLLLVPLYLLRRWSIRRKADSQGDPLDGVRHERGLSAGMLLPGVMVTTFGAFDWLMSLQPDWFSSAFGLYYLNGSAVGAVASVIILAHVGRRTGLLRDVVTPHHFHALGRVLFAFVILWTYVAYFQVFFVVLTDKPSETSFYIARGHGAWKDFGPLLAVGHAAIPVLLLSKRSWKLHSGFLALISAWLLVMHYIDLYYLVMPVQSPESAALSWIDLATLAGTLGSLVAFCAFVQRGKPLVAIHDPLLPRGLHYRSET